MLHKTLIVFLIGISIQCKVDAQPMGAIKGEGELVKKEISLDAIKGVGLSISGTLILTQGPTQRVTIEGQQNVIDNLRKEVHGGSWNIEFIKNVSDAKPVTITIVLSTLEEIGLAGSGMIKSTNTFTGLDEIEISVAGSGTVYFGMNASKTEISVSGSGKVNVDGSTSDLDINLSGSGKVNAADLEAENCDVAISGSGGASVQVNHDLDADISGSGSVTYAGEANVHSSISGSGSVSKR